MEKITVIVPINNAASYLSQCLDSVLCQTFRDFKLILINDGSTDESAYICRKYAKRDERVVIYHQRNQGISVAKNKGIEAAGGKYIMFIKANEVIEPDLLQDAYDAAETEQVDWMIWSFKKMIYDKHGRLTDSRNVQAADLVCRTENECKNQFISMVGWDSLLIGASWNKLYRKDIITDNKLFFSTLRREQDIIFNLEYLKHIKSFIAVSKIYSNLQISDRGYEDRVLQQQYDNAYFSHLRYRQLLDFWRREKEEGDFVDYHFLTDVFEIMKYAMKPAWQLGFFKKYSYIKSLMKKIEVKEIARYVTEQNNLAGLRGRVIKWKINCIKKQKVLRMLIIYYFENAGGRKRNQQKMKVLDSE